MPSAEADSLDLTYSSPHSRAGYSAAPRLEWFHAREFLQSASFTHAFIRTFILRHSERYCSGTTGGIHDKLIGVLRTPIHSALVLQR